MTRPLRVLIWNEGLHEQQNPVVAAHYPRGLHQTLADGLAASPGARPLAVRNDKTADPDQGLGQPQLEQTDVLLWWGHLAHDQIPDETVARLQRRVWQGMGLIVLHSGHASRIFQALMGTSCMLRWRDVGETERIWVVQPSHPIAHQIEETWELAASEMYGEYFDIPTPDELVFVSWFAGGEVFRSGCTFHRGLGKIFYFSPGHETYPIYHHPTVQQVLRNAVQWSAPSLAPYSSEARQSPPFYNLMPGDPECR